MAPTLSKKGIKGKWCTHHVLPCVRYNGNFTGFVHSSSKQRKPKSAHSGKKRKSSSSKTAPAPVAKRTSLRTPIAPQPRAAVKTNAGSFDELRFDGAPEPPLHTAKTSAPRAGPALTHSAPPPYTPQLKPAVPLLRPQPQPLPLPTAGRPQLARFLRDAGIGTAHIEGVLTIADEVGIEAPSDFTEVTEKELLSFGFKVIQIERARRLSRAR